MPVITMKDYDFTGSITYAWWCPACVTYHYYPEGCPFDLRGDSTDDRKDFADNRICEICPHCGQFIKNPLEGT